MNIFAMNKSLIYAAEKGYEEIVRLLLRKRKILEGFEERFKWGIGPIKGFYLDEVYNLDIDAINKALICAAENGYTKIFELLLLQTGVDINAENSKKKNSTYYSCRKRKRRNG